MRSHRNTKPRIGAICAALWCASFTSTAALAEGEPPHWAPPRFERSGPARVRNVVLISVDTLRRDYVSAFGAPKGLGVSHRTPHIDALASSGSAFLDAVATAPSTALSHDAIFLSLLAPITGKRGIYDLVRGEVSHPIETLRAAGLQTAAFAGDGQMEGGLGWSTGFDRFENVNFRQLAKDDLDRRELGQLEAGAFDWLDAHHEEPFFLFFHTYEVHCPHWPPPDLRTHYLKGWPGPARAITCTAELEAPHLPYLRRLYAGSVAHVDTFVGRLVAKLASLGREGDTLLILLSDHGEQLGEGDGRVGHGRFHPSVLEVPLIVRIPGLAPQRSHDRVSTIDVMPTIYSALGLAPPYPFMGRDLVPLMEGRESFPPDRLRFAHRAKLLAVIDGPWVLEALETGEIQKLGNRALDPEGLKDFAEAQPERSREMLAAHDAMLAAHSALKKRFRVESISAEEHRQRQLEALGYVVPHPLEPAND